MLGHVPGPRERPHFSDVWERDVIEIHRSRPRRCVAETPKLRRRARTVESDYEPFLSGGRWPTGLGPLCA